MEVVEKDSNLISNFDLFISPWVLPNEPILIQIHWKEDFEFNHIVFDIPTDFAFVEAINIHESLLIEKNQIFIKKNQIISRNEGITYPSFFCIILKYTNMQITKLKKFEKIPIKFYNNDLIISEFQPIAKVFRPLLKNITRLDQIILSDGSIKYEIHINLESEGFGNISTRSILDINSYEFEPDLTIVTRVIQKLEKKCQNNEIYRTFDISIEDISDFIKNIKEIKIFDFNPSGFLKLLNDNIKFIFIFFDFLLEAFAEIKITNKTESVKLLTPTIVIPKDKFNEKIAYMRLKLYYTDNLLNEYEPVEIIIPIVDLREKIGITNIEFKIKILDVKDNTFGDIEKVD